MYRFLAVVIIIGVLGKWFMSIDNHVCIKHTKSHNDSHRHGTILKEVAFIFSFDLYNRFDCF